jgi:hypothetical protein
MNKHIPMMKPLLSSLLLLFSLQFAISQDCAISAVIATPSACTGNYFMVTIDVEYENPASPGFTLAGNGTIYGTYLYADLPVTIGPFLGDDESVYEFIVWDVENGDCQNYTTLDALNCGPICSFSNASLVNFACLTSNAALVEFNFTATNPSSVAFDLFYGDGTPVSIGSYLYSALPITINYFQLNGAAPITLIVCDNENDDCCETFVLPAIDCDTNNCEIFNMVGDPECTGNNFLFHLDFDY